MRGKVCIVTGANSGIGRVTARELARRGARVLMVCRSKERGEEARQALVRESGSEALELFLADLSSLDQVRRVAREIEDAHQSVDLLVNNAGALLSRKSQSPDGFEATLATNHLGPFLLTNLLLDALRAGGSSRVVTVSSAVHIVGEVRIDKLDGGWPYLGLQVYANTKLMNILFTAELARRLQGSGVRCNSVHPGVVASHFGLGRPGIISLFYRVSRPFIRSAEKGAETVLFLATSPQVGEVTGRYFYNCKPGFTARAARDMDLARRLWQKSEELVGL